MKMYTIEIDEKIWKYLQKNAEPFVDTPNSVLNRLLFNEDEEEQPVLKIPSVTIEGVPDALAQILEVIYEMEINGFTRIQATNRVAEKRCTTPQAIAAKYCRQLSKKAQEIEALLEEPGYDGFIRLLKDKFSNQKTIIETYFDSLLMGTPAAC